MLFSDVTCRKPTLPFNAVLKQNETDYNIDDIINFECIPGYRIFGQSTAKCLPNGKWSKIRGRCSSKLKINSLFYINNIKSKLYFSIYGRYSFFFVYLLYF